MPKRQDTFDLSTFLPYRLTVIAEELSAGLAKQYQKEFGISVAEWRVLVHIADAGSVSIREIHKKVHLVASRASRAATRLEKSGYISKCINEKDRRLVALELTAKGEALMKNLLRIALDYQNQIEEIIEPHREGLNNALNAITDELPGLKAR